MASDVLQHTHASSDFEVLKLFFDAKLFTCSLEAVQDQRDEGYHWPTKQWLGKKASPGMFQMCYYVFHNNLYQDSALGSFYTRTRVKTIFKRCHRKCHNSQWEHKYRVYRSNKLTKPQGRTDLNLSPQNVKFSWLWWEGVTLMHKKEDTSDQSTFRETVPSTFCLKCAPN